MRQADGEPVIWLMNGLAAPTYQTTTARLDNSWVLLGTGNFDGLSDTEILWAGSNGQFDFWALANGYVYSTCFVTGNLPGVGDGIVGIGDVNGDGISDIVWIGAADGHVHAAILQGCGNDSSVDFGPAPNSASAVAVGNFFGDGHVDVLWNANGVFSIWQLNGSGIVSQSDLNPAIPAEWRVAGTADFNQDGKADLLWRLPDGSLTISLMNGPLQQDTPIQPADRVFADGFDGMAPAPGLPASWHVVDTGDYNGDGSPDILFVDDLGNAQIWQMSGTSVTGTFAVPPTPQMPYPGTTGWVLPLDRPFVTQQNGQVNIAIHSLPGIASNVLYMSTAHDPATTGTSIIVNGSSYLDSASDMATKGFRYFSATTSVYGFNTPPSPEAYLVGFNPVALPYLGPMTIADINGDDCMDILGAYGDCQGNFTIFTESSIGLGALRANNRVWRDVRFADFNGDGIPDAIANVYACDVPECGGDDTNSQILLFLGNGDGTFTEDPTFTALNVPGGGFGETIAVADFDNDGCLDIFLPKYTFYASSEHNFLLMNDCSGHFTDMAVAAGVDMSQWPLNYRPEGAEAADIDGDGRIDLYTGSHLFINRTVQVGQPAFTDESAKRGLSIQFDEGAKFLDWNNDGNLDLVLQDTQRGPQLYQSNGYAFTLADALPALVYNQADGINVADIDGDGRPDIIAAAGCPAGVGTNCFDDTSPHQKARLLLNRGSAFVASDFYDDGYTDDSQRPLIDLSTVADFDENGGADVVLRHADVVPGTETATTGFMKVLLNQGGSARTIRVTVLGAAGERNQYGRVVRVTPQALPGFVMTQVVDGGSGYMANTPYVLQFAAPYFGAYDIDVGFANYDVAVTAVAGQNVVVYANGSVTGAATAAQVRMRQRASVP